MAQFFIAKTGQKFQITTGGDWALADSYRSGDVIAYQGALYKANADIPANTAFATGTSGATWYPYSSGGIAENGQVSIPAQVMAASTNTWNTVTGGTLTLPSAGTYEINYTIQAGDSGQWSGFGLFTSGGTFVDGSGSHSIASGTDSLLQFNQSFIVTVTASTTYTLKCKSYSGAQVTIASSEPSITLVSGGYGGSSQITYKKIAGFLPATGTTVSYLSYNSNVTNPGPTSTISNPSSAVGATLSNGVDFGSMINVSTNMTYNASAGTFLLKAGVTYEIIYSIKVDAGGSNQFWCNTSTCLVNSSNVVLVASAADTMGVAFNARGIAYPGTNIITYTPTVDTTCKLRVSYSSDNSNLMTATVGVKQIGSSWTSQFTGTLTNSWSITNSYAAGTIVVNSSLLYQANGSIPAGTAFVVGTTGSTWTQVGAGTIGAETGVVTSVTDGSSTSSTTPSLVPGSTFTVPTAGTWEINYNASVKSDTNYGVAVILWNVTTNTAVPGTYSSGCLSPGSTQSIDTLNASTLVTTTGATQFALYFASLTASNTARIYNGYVSGDVPAYTEGSTTITYKKVSGSLVPANGSTADYGSYTLAAGRSSTGVYTLTALQGNMPVVSSTNVLLKAGNTYELRASLSIRCAYAVFQWQTSGAVQIGLAGDSFSANSGDPGVTLPAHAIYTPTVDTNVQIALTSINTYVQTDTIYGEISIKQIGTTNASAFVGMLSTGYSSTITYPAGTIVANSGFLYQANSTIPAGTPWATGSSGATWTLMNTQAAEYGESLLATTVAPSNSSVTTLLTASIPTAGTWEIEYSLNVEAGGGSSTDGCSFWVADSGGTEVVGSGQTYYTTVNANNASNLSRKVIVTTTGSTSYTVRGWRYSDGSTVNVLGGGVMAGVQQSTLSTSKGTSKVTWKKISGFVPVTPSNEVTGYANDVTVFNTGFGFGLYLQGTEQQFFIKNLSGATINFSNSTEYFSDSGGKSSVGGRGKVSLANNATSTLWTDTTLSMSGAGDFESGTIYISTNGVTGYNNSATVSKYTYFCGVGAGFNNNYFRVTKIF